MVRDKAIDSEYNNIPPISQYRTGKLGNIQRSIGGRQPFFKVSRLTKQSQFRNNRYLSIPIPK